MNKIYIHLFAFMVLVLSSCSEGSSKAEAPVVDSKESTPDDGLKHLMKIKQQIDKGDYKQIEGLVSQVNARISEDSVQMTAEQRLSFQQPSKEILIDFLRSINLDSLKANKEFEKKYSFNSAPKGYKPDSNECPDGLTLSLRENASEFTLSIDNRFLVDADIGCAESMTIYYLSVEREKLLLKRLDYAG